MFDGTTITLFFITCLALAATPGPDMMYVLARSIGQGRMAGIASLLGISTGFLIHIFAAAFGLSTFLRTSDTAFQVVKYAGAVYLIYLGIRTLLSGENVGSVSGFRKSTLVSIYRQGFITNVLNPKIPLFFLAFIPQFVNPSRGSVALQFIVLGLLLNLAGTIVQTLIVLLSTPIAAWIKKNPKFLKLQKQFTGGVFISLGAGLALAKSK